MCLSRLRSLGALQQSPHDGDPPYMHSLIQSMSLVFDEFYSMLTAVEFSAATGIGSLQLVNAIEAARQEYFTNYKPELDRLIEEKEQRQLRSKTKELEKLMKDIELSEEPKQ